GSITFPEAVFNQLGYQLINQGQLEDAITIMRLNAEAYPNSANCWDSYADACLAAQDTAMARTCYETVLKVLPDDQNLGADLINTLTTNANNFLNPSSTIEENLE
ncbi:MAG: hypothetical protein ABIJ45_03650, partial [Candidatus Zixiibacteriota bacterium]